MRQPGLAAHRSRPGDLAARGLAWPPIARDLATWPAAPAAPVAMWPASTAAVPAVPATAAMWPAVTAAVPAVPATAAMWPAVTAAVPAVPATGAMWLAVNTEGLKVDSVRSSASSGVWRPPIRYEIGV